MKIRVDNLCFSSTEAELRRAFECCGSVVSVNVKSRETGIRLGFAMVEMTHASEAHDAIRALDGTVLGRRNIRVHDAQDRP